MKKVLYIHHGIGIGGASLSLLQLIRGLDRSRYEPTVLCLHESEATELYRREGCATLAGTGTVGFPHSTVNWLRWYRLPAAVYAALSSLLTAFRVAPRVYRELRPDLVHLNSPSLAAWAFAARRRGIPVACHVREPMAAGYCGRRRAILRAALHRNVSVFLAVSRYDAGTLRCPEKTRVVHNYVDAARFDRGLDGGALRERLGIGPEVGVVLYLGGLNRVKGIDCLLAAAPAVLDAGGTLLVAGHTPETRPGIRRTLRRVAAAAGIERFQQRMAKGMAALGVRPGVGRLVHLGFRDDVPELLAAADVVVFPSSVPHFARPVIEAAIMGKPSVMSDHGCARELIEDGVTGLLVTPGDSVALASAVVRLLSHSGERLEMGRRACERATEMFGERNAEIVWESYERIMRM